MSIQALHYVFTASPAERRSRLVLFSLANHANDAFLSWPAVQTIAREARVHERNAQHALRKLERDGEIERVGEYSHGGRRTQTYLLVRCQRWYALVGAPTSEIANGTSTVYQRLPNENAVNEVKKGPKGGDIATPATSLRHPSHVTTPPQPRHSATPATSYRHPSSTVIATPATSQRHPWGGAGATQSFIEPSLNRQLQEPPYPPQAGGTPTRNLVPKRWNAVGGYLLVYTRPGARLLTHTAAEALRGSMIDVYAHYFRSQGFTVEVHYDE